MLNKLDLDEPITQAAYSRAVGVSRARISQLVKAGTIVLDENKKVIPRQANAALSIRQMQIGSATTMTAASQVSAEVGRSHLEPDGDFDHAAVFQESRARREFHDARVAEMKADELAGELIRSEDVRRQQFEVARTIRNHLLSIPDRVAAEIAGVSDPAKVHQILLAEIRQALERLADVLREESAQGYS